MTKYNKRALTDGHKMKAYAIDAQIDVLDRVRVKSNPGSAHQRVLRGRLEQQM